MLAVEALCPGLAKSRPKLALAWLLVAGPLAHAAAPDLPLDASSCAALAAAAARGGGQFPLGRAACGLVDPPQRTPSATSSHARQLQLYAPEAGAAPLAAPASTPAAQPAVPTPRRGVRGPAARPLPAPLARAVRLAPEIDRAAASNQIDPLLLHAIARIESRHDPAAVSHAGARGLMQVMPATGARFGVDQAESLHLVPLNLEVSARYLRLLKKRFPGDLSLVLAAYNAGEGAVERHGRRIPPYAETQAYVRKVLQEYARLRHAAGGLK